jgi:hypothetical protein
MESPKPTALKLSRVEKLSAVVSRCVAGPNSVRPEGEYFVARDLSGLGLSPVDSCPGSTETCEEVCYAIDAEYRTRTDILLQDNYELLLSCENVDEIIGLLDDAVVAYIEDADKHGVPENKRQFRIHWSGDFYSVEYALAWRVVMAKYENIQFYAYTRTFTDDVNVVPILADLPNLDLFLSVDKDNVYKAKPVLEANPDAKVGYLVKYLEEVDELVDILDRREGYRSRPCPENMRRENGIRRLPVISEKGGACSRCTYCIGKPDNWDVVFVDTGYEFEAQNKFDFDGMVPVEFKPRRRRRDRVAQPAGELVTAQVTQDELF